MAGSFVIHVAGDFAPGAVDIAIGVEDVLPPPAVAEMIEKEWERARRRPGIHLFDGPMVRLNSWSLSDGRLRLVLGRTTYKRFWGTNLTHPELADQYGSDVLANALGLSAVLQSADGHLLFGRRNGRVAYYPNRIHPFAGSAENGDLFEEMRRELREELSLEKADISHLACMGLAEDGSIRQPELIFGVETRLSRTEIAGNLDAGEHLGIWAARSEPAAVREALGEEALTPIAAAALTMWLKKTGNKRIGYLASRAASRHIR